jgi:3-dehydroquinate dehydratase-2
VRTVLVLNGPDLNLLGTREPSIYGSATLADVERMCHDEAGKLGLKVDFRQSNHEGQLIDWIQGAGPECAAGRLLGAVLNPGALTHTSLALHDAIKAADLPVVELHISSVHAREEVRRHSFVSPAARGIVVGFGVASYPLIYRSGVERHPLASGMTAVGLGEAAAFGWSAAARMRSRPAVQAEGVRRWPEAQRGLSNDPNRVGSRDAASWSPTAQQPQGARRLHAQAWLGSRLPASTRKRACRQQLVDVGSWPNSYLSRRSTDWQQIVGSCTWAVYACS